MISEEVVKELVIEKISGSDIYIVDVYIHPVNRIFVELDSLQGINIKDCLGVSRHIEQNLDRDVEDYELQVSSSGLDQPFKILKQYEKNLGKEVEVLKKDGIKLSGVLAHSDENNIILDVTTKVKDSKSKKKINTTQSISISYTEIKETKIVISFK